MKYISLLITGLLFASCSQGNTPTNTPSENSKTTTESTNTGTVVISEENSISLENGYILMSGLKGNKDDVKKLLNYESDADRVEITEVSNPYALFTLSHADKNTKAIMEYKDGNFIELWKGENKPNKDDCQKLSDAAHKISLANSCK